MGCCKTNLVVILGVLLVRSYVDSFSSGAPESTCDQMVPQHSRNPQGSSPPYSITPSSTSVFGGERITLKLEATGSDPFKGFFIQARDSSEDSQRVGTFFTSTHNPRTCGARNNAVTHIDASQKKTVTLEWEAPSDYEGEIFFRASVVKEYVTFWTNLQSEKVSVKKRTVVDFPEKPEGEEEKPETTTEAPLGGIEKAVKEIYFGCGTIKTCVGTPEGCVNRKECSSFTSFTKVDDSEFEFEVMGPSQSSRGYAAVGLSEDEFMGDDSVVVCEYNGRNVDVYNSWNQGRTNVPVISRNSGLTVYESGVFEGQQYCRFHRAAVTEFKNKKFDLNTEKYHVMVASGPTREGGALLHHGTTNRHVTQGLVNLGLTEKLSFSSIRFEDIHAALMIIAWVGAASCGMLFARYFKQTWLNYKCMNIDQWFHLHRFFMILTWSLNIAGLVMIVLKLKEFRMIDHAFIGIASIILCFIQPFMAMCRPGPGAKNRWVFNWFHWFVGNSAQILGIAAIFFGMEIKFGVDTRNWIKEVMWYILIVFIAYHCLVHLILSILQCVSDRRAKKPNDVFPLKDLSDSRIPLQAEKIKEDAPLGGLRKFFLGIYLPVNWIATALLVICVIFTKGEIEDTFESWGLPTFWKELEAQRVH